MCEAFLSFCSERSLQANPMWETDIDDDPNIVKLHGYALVEMVGFRGRYLGTVIIQELKLGGFAVFMHAKEPCSDALATEIRNHFVREES